MTTLFISDLHLDDRRPEITARLMRFLEQEAGDAEALYILGDLFEYWLGDDAAAGCALEVADRLRALSDSGVNCFFAHGNRDFLLRDEYAARAGLTLLDTETVVELCGEKTLLMHGDSLCTDDVEYQQFRGMVRNSAWQADFLARPVPERIRIASQARDASAEHKGQTSMAIMDVNQAEVVSTMARHGVQRLIHGHTHRPGVHEIEVSGRPAQRIVLGDWHARGSVLRVTDGRYELAELPA